MSSCAKKIMCHIMRRQDVCCLWKTKKSSPLHLRDLHAPHTPPTPTHTHTTHTPAHIVNLVLPRISQLPGEKAWRLPIGRMTNKFPAWKFTIGKIFSSLSVARCLITWKSSSNSPLKKLHRLLLWKFGGKTD